MKTKQELKERTIDAPLAKMEGLTALNNQEMQGTTGGSTLKPAFFTVGALIVADPALLQASFKATAEKKLL